MKRRHWITASTGASLWLMSSAGYAYPVEVINTPMITTPITTSITAHLNALRVILVGGTDNMSVAGASDRLRMSLTGNEKLTGESVAFALKSSDGDQNANRDLDRGEERQRRYALPPDPCAAAEISAGIGALPGGVSGAVGAGTGGGSPRAGGAIRAGGSQIARVQNEQRAVTTAPATEISRARTVDAHAVFCSPEEANAPGGRSLCPQGANATLPNASALASNLYDKPSLNQQETDAASLFVRNLITPEPPRALSQREYESDQGRSYFAIQKQYETLANLAAEPLNRARVDRTGHRILIQQTDPKVRAAGTAIESLVRNMNAAGGASAGVWAPINAKAAGPGGVSYQEIIGFEVNRRFGNLEWLKEMATVSPEALAREQVLILALQVKLMHEMNARLERMEGISGAMLASMGRGEYAPRLATQLAIVRGAGK